MSKRPPNQLPTKGAATSGPLSKKSKVSGKETDTDDELAKAKRGPVGPLDAFIKNHKKQIAERINFVEENAPEYSSSGKRPIGVLASVMKVKEARKMMDAASSMEDFANAQKYKDEYETYYAIGEKETHLYHYCTWLVEYATGKMEKYKTVQKFTKAAEWRDRRDIARAYITLVPENDVGCLFNKLTTEGEAVAFDPFADTTTDEQSGVAVADDATNAASTATTTADDNDVINIDDNEDVINVDDDEDVMNVDDDDEEVEEEEEEEAAEEEDEAANGGGAPAARATKAKSKNSRKRKSKKYTPVAKTTAVVNTTKQPKGKPPSDNAFYKFINQASFTVHRNDKPPCTIVPKNQGYELASHYLFCSTCKERIAWNNRGKHAVTAKHTSALAASIALAADLKKGRKKCQKRIDDEGLVGSTYSNEKIDAQLLWLKVACRGNWSLKSVEDNRVSSCLYVPLPCIKYFVDMIN